MQTDQIQNTEIKKLGEAVRNSNSIAYTKLFDLLWEDMYIFASAILTDQQLAKDITQEVWIDYWNRRKSIESTHIKAYLYKAIRYKCYNSLRSRPFSTTHLEAAKTLPASSFIEEEENLIALNNKIQTVLKDLPKRCQEIFELSRINNFPKKQIDPQEK